MRLWSLPEVRITNPEFAAAYVTRLIPLLILSPSYTREEALSNIRRSIEGRQWVCAELKQGKEVVQECPFGAVRAYPSHVFAGMSETCLDRCPPRISHRALVFKESIAIGRMGMYSTPAFWPKAIPGPFDLEQPWTNASMELGYALMPEWRGQELGTGMVKAFIERYLWPRMRLRAVEAVGTPTTSWPLFTR